MVPPTVVIALGLVRHFLALYLFAPIERDIDPLEENRREQAWQVGDHARHVSVIRVLEPSGQAKFGDIETSTSVDCDDVVLSKTLGLVPSRGSCGVLPCQRFGDGSRLFE